MPKKVENEIVQNPVTPEPKKRGGSIGFIIAIIILVFLLLASFATSGFLYYIYSKEKQQSANLNGQIESLKKDINKTNSQNDLLKKENEFYKANWQKTQVNITNPYDKTTPTVTGSYIINDSNSRLVSESELYNLTPWELKVARNEIYARHGRSFVSKDLSCYFASQGWYKADSNFSDSSLSNIEKQNVSTILNYEKKINSPLMNYDSGC